MGARIVETEAEMVTAGMTPEEVSAAVQRLYDNRAKAQQSSRS